eukprot:1453661-Rhodomonas_salina.1
MVTNPISQEYAWEGDRGRAFAESRPQSAQGREGRRSTPHKGARMSRAASAVLLSFEHAGNILPVLVLLQGIFPADEMADKRTRYQCAVHIGRGHAKCWSYAVFACEN